MSRTVLCAGTAAGLAALSLGLMLTRYRILGGEAKLPAGPGTWKVTLLVQGKTTRPDARVLTEVPLGLDRHPVRHEVCQSKEFAAKPQDAGRPKRRQVLWSARPGVSEAPFRIRYEFYCAPVAPDAPPSRLARELYAAPKAGEYLRGEPCVESDDPRVSELARKLTAGIDGPRDQLEALFVYVADRIDNEPSLGQAVSALECLHQDSGDAAGKSRLLAALCRNRGIPARLVQGLLLRAGRDQKPHVWAEAWVHGHWLPLCPANRHFGRLPASYFVYQLGDAPLVRGRHVRSLDYAFLVERHVPREETSAPPSNLRRALASLSLHRLPLAEKGLVEFLLLLPVAALLICVFRNVIGLGSFGTFAPALLGLAFRDLSSLPGLGVFVAIVLIGWLLRRGLDRYHLLQVPRTALLLSLVVALLILAVVAANYQDVPATRYISIFPIVILVGMVERFWTLEVEDTTASSFRTLLGTLAIAATISLLLGLRAVVNHLLAYPETLGLVMAAQLLLGRYTGYRLAELWRFRDFLRGEVESPVRLAATR